MCQRSVAGICPVILLYIFFPAEGSVKYSGLNLASFNKCIYVDVDFGWKLYADGWDLLSSLDGIFKWRKYTGVDTEH